MPQTKTTRTMQEIIDEVKKIDFTTAGSYFVSKEELDEMTKQEREKVSRSFWYEAGLLANAKPRMVGMFISSHKDEAGIHISWGQNSDV